MSYANQLIEVASLTFALLIELVKGSLLLKIRLLVNSPPLPTAQNSCLLGASLSA